MVFLMGHCSQVSSFASRVARADPPPLGKMFEPKPTRSIAPACVRFLKIGNLGNGPFGFRGPRRFPQTPGRLERFGVLRQAYSVPKPRVLKDLGLRCIFSR
jgi:hypothetical protein